MSHHVLIVDDDELVRTGLAANLEREGYRVSTAASADEALRSLETSPADLVLTDLVMEGMDGLALLRRLTAQMPDLPVIVMTAYGNTENAIEALRGRATDYIRKPARSEEIAHRIRTVLDARDLQRQLLKERLRIQAQRRERERSEIERERRAALGLFAAGMAEDVDAAARRLAKAGVADSALETLRKFSKRLADLADLEPAAQPTPLDLNRNLEEFLESERFQRVRNRAGHRHVEKRFSRPLAPARIACARDAEALRDLVEMAARVAADSPVTISTRSERISDGDGAPRHYAVLRAQFPVRTPIRNCDRLFDPYMIRRELGWPADGLELAAVEAAARRAGGFASAQTSGENQCLEIAIGLPFAETPRGASEAAPRSRGAERVLVVDDTEAHRHEARRMLEQLGYAVECVDSGRAAAVWIEERLRRGEPPADLMLIDLVLGEAQDGVETFRRARELNPRQKALLMGGFVETQRVLEALENGISQYLRKPLSVEALGRAVRAALDGE